ncbi:MAG: BACON domain-containing protein [Tannerella sp.]|nr:BACON domain-containing protein [Tannerella sp.]
MSTFSIPSWVTKDSFKLVTNEDYTITQSPANTVTLNRTSGTKDTTITFTFSSANTTTTPRTATLKISGGDAPERTVTVTQRKQPVDDTPISLSSAAQYFTIPVTGAWTNGTLTYGNTSGDGWINNLTTPSTSRTVSLNSTGLGSESITLHVSQNTGTTSRTATIKITVESKEYSISISQSVANKSVSPLSLNFTEAGGEANLNVYFETKSWVATTSASWLTVTPDKGSWGEGYSVKVTAVKNDLVTVNGTARTATITFKPQDLKPGDDSVQVTVRQTNPAAKLDYRPLIIKEFAWAGDSLAINITSNVVWVAEVPAPSDRTWLSVEPSTGSGNGRFIIWAKANMSDYPRSGRVRISSPASIELNRNIDITQSRIVLPPDSITFETNTQNPKVHWVTPEGGSGLVKIKFHPSTSVENQEVIWMVDKNPHLVKPLTTYSNSGCVVQGNGKEGKATLIAFLKSDYKVSAECTIDVRKTPPPVAVEPVDATSAYVTAVAPGKLTVNTPVSERISVYTVGGALLLQVQKAAGPAVVDIGLRPDVGSILIVSGESGWTQKVAVK